METKDWIIMLVPIVVNGFILFIFQKVWEIKSEKKKAISDKKQPIRDGFKDIAMKANMQFYDVKTELTEIMEKDTFFDKTNDFISTLGELYKYSICFETILIDECIIVKEIADEFKQLVYHIDHRIKSIPSIHKEQIIDLYVNHKISLICHNFSKLVDLCFNK